MDILADKKFWELLISLTGDSATSIQTQCDSESYFSGLESFRIKWTKDGEELALQFSYSEREFFKLAPRQHEQIKNDILGCVRRTVLSPLCGLKPQTRHIGIAPLL